MVVDEAGGRGEVSLRKGGVSQCGDNVPCPSSEVFLITFALTESRCLFPVNAPCRTRPESLRPVAPRNPAGVFL